MNASARIHLDGRVTSAKLIRRATMPEQHQRVTAYAASLRLGGSVNQFQVSESSIHLLKSQSARKSQARPIPTLPFPSPHPGCGSNSSE